MINENISARQGVENDDRNVVCLVGHILTNSLTKVFAATRRTARRNVMTPKRRSSSITVLLLTIVVAAPQLAYGYATFTHEQLIDLAWNNSIPAPRRSTSGRRMLTRTAVASFRTSGTIPSEKNSSATSLITCAVVTLF